MFTSLNSTGKRLITFLWFCFIACLFFFLRQGPVIYTRLLYTQFSYLSFPSPQIKAIYHHTWFKTGNTLCGICVEYVSRHIWDIGVHMHICANSEARHREWMSISIVFCLNFCQWVSHWTWRLPFGVDWLASGPLGIYQSLPCLRTRFTRGYTGPPQD